MGLVAVEFGHAEWDVDEFFIITNREPICY